MKNVEIMEHSLSFCAITETTGKELEVFLFSFLKDLEIHIIDMCGQDYNSV